MIRSPRVSRAPAYDLRTAKRSEVLALFETHHGYRSLSNHLTYCFAIFESGRIVAAFAWQPPPPGAAKAVCPEAPQGVLALSRMVAVDRCDRKLKHISKPLRRQMAQLIDRTRWPVLVTYSDEGQGHNGFVYQCSGWTATVRSKRPISQDAGGARRSIYSNGKAGARPLERAGFTHIQRWEQRACPPGQAAELMAAAGWKKSGDRGKEVGERRAGASVYPFIILFSLAIDSPEYIRI